jgi:hypothetical protein
MQYRSSMKKLLLVLCLSLSTAWACRCNPELNNSMLARPDSAPHSFVGKIERREGKLGMKVEGAWTLVKDFYEFEDISSCRLRLPEGERFVVLASSRELLHRCSTVFVPIQNAQELMKKLSTKEGVHGIQNPTWGYCEKDEDCILSPDPCKRVSAVNRSHLATYEKFVKEAQWACPDQVTLYKARVVCMKNYCLPKPDQF